MHVLYNNEWFQIAPSPRGTPRGPLRRAGGAWGGGGEFFPLASLGDSQVELSLWFGLQFQHIFGNHLIENHQFSSVINRGVINFLVPCPEIFRRNSPGVPPGWPVGGFRYPSSTSPPPEDPWGSRRGAIWNRSMSLIWILEYKITVNPYLVSFPRIRRHSWASLAMVDRNETRSDSHARNNHCS